MVLIKGGSFMMGSEDSEANDDEKPIHKENVNDFYLDKYELTQNLWELIMGNNPSHKKGNNFPVDQVTWDKAQEFIWKLNNLTGLNFRLPTESEWEFAAKGGNVSRNFKFSGSNKQEEVAWYPDISGKQTHPVGLKKPNELGLYDMSGNVWEWTSDKASKNYNSPRTMDSYIMRGGGAYKGTRDGRVTSRGFLPINSTNYGIGLRLAL